jgi:hypothetical protein
VDIAADCTECCTSGTCTATTTTCN